MSAEAEKRHRMVKEQIEARGIKDPALLAVFDKIPRHLFVPPECYELAYTDRALPAYCNQTISQPYIVAKMTEQLFLTKSHKVLEIGTGTGYQTVILAELAGEVYTLEIISELYERAKNHSLVKMYDNIHFIAGSGYDGYEPAAPYDAIIVTAAPRYIPEKLIEQLSPRGRMVIPVGTLDQNLELVIRDYNNKISITRLLGVRFVPMI